MRGFPTGRLAGGVGRVIDYMVTVIRTTIDQCDEAIDSLLFYGELRARACMCALEFRDVVVKVNPRVDA